MLLLLFCNAFLNNKNDFQDVLAGVVDFHIFGWLVGWREGGGANNY